MTKKCPICQRTLKRKIKKIKKVNIFECENCQLAILEKNISLSSEKLYSLENYQKEVPRLKKRFHYLSAIITKYIKKGEVLDVGSGFGLFSSILAKKGDYHFLLLDKYVFPYLFKDRVDFNYKKEDYLRFLKIYKKKFDLILMLDIIEHFKDPNLVLKKTNKILRKNGYLVIQTPNYQSLMAKICQYWSWWMVEDHKLIFSPKSIRKVLNKTNFKVVYFKTYEDFYDFKKNLDGNFSQIAQHFLRKIGKLFFFFLFIPFYFTLRKLLWGLGYGGAIFLVAKKV